MQRSQQGFSSISHPKAQSVVFDLGGVLVDWNPVYLYQKLIPDRQQRDWFLTKCCSRDWILEQDTGRPWAAGNAFLIERHPAHRAHIEAFRERWLEMLRGTIAESVSLVTRLHQRKIPLYALSNWAADTFALSIERLPFLSIFDGVMISGDVGVRKPDRRIFQLFAERYGVEPGTSLFIDDTMENIDTARALGFDTIHCTSPSALRHGLEQRGLLNPSRGSSQ